MASEGRNSNISGSRSGDSLDLNEIQYRPRISATDVSSSENNSSAPSVRPNDNRQSSQIIENPLTPRLSNLDVITGKTFYSSPKNYSSK